MISLPDLKAWLQSEGVTAPISLTSQPEDPTNCYTLFNTGRLGLRVENAFDTPTFQVITRAASGALAYEMADEIDRIILDAGTSFDLGGRHVLYTKNLSGPQELGLDQRDRPEYTANYWMEVSRV